MSCPLPLSEMPGRRSSSGCFASSRGAAASAAVSRAGLQPSVPVPPPGERTALWAGWCPHAFEQLAAMNPLALGVENSALVSARRCSAGPDDLPTFARDGCPAVLLDLLPHVEVLPAVVADPPAGAVVTILSAENFSLVYDRPLPVILRRRRVSVSLLGPDLRLSGTKKFWPVRSDIERVFPRVIFLSRQCAITMAFAEWVDRRRRLIFNVRTLHQELHGAFLDTLAELLRQRGSLCPEAPEHVLSLVPSPYVLRLVSDRCLDCFLPAYFEEHIRLARQIDGAGLRLDAEFKMVQKVRSARSPKSAAGKRLKLESPFKCILACRGVRGLYLAPLTLSRAFETGDGYVEFLLPLLRARRASCEGEVGQGMPNFLSFDNGPAYSLYAIAALGEVWPQAVYGRDKPPCSTPARSRHHRSLRADVVDVVSDPPHRRWHWQHTLPSMHPDRFLFDQCLAFALARISEDHPLIPRASVVTEKHGRGYDEDERLLRDFSRLSCPDALKECAQSASAFCRQRLQEMLRSHNVRRHGFLKRVFGSVPPNKILFLWARALDVNPHPDAMFTGYHDSGDFGCDIRRIASWFSVVRKGYTIVARKPEEEGSAVGSSRLAGPLLLADQVVSFQSMLNEPLHSSLLRCGDAHRRFSAMGLRVPTGTTIVEQGFGASSRLLFDKATQWVTESTFKRNAMLTCLLLNFAILRRLDCEFLGSRDKRVLILLESAWSRLHASAGISLGRHRGDAEALFREAVGRLEAAEDVEPVDGEETAALLPFAEDSSEASE